VEYLQGMFAFAIADGHTLFLARDRLGIKPLYYAFMPEKRLFLFASEIKALLQCPDVDASLDMQAIIDSMVLFHPTGTHTFFRHIRAFPPGHTMTITLTTDRQFDLVSHQYFSLLLDPDATLSFAAAQEQVSKLFYEAVLSHVHADVEVGLFLSGGLDSSLLAVAMQKLYQQQLLTFTVADSPHHPDAVQSELLAHSLHTTHTALQIPFAEFFAALPANFTAAERPILPSSTFYLLCKRIREQVKVALIGEGADELFGGYREYIDQSYLVTPMKQGLAQLKRLGLTPGSEVVDLFNRLSSATTFKEYLKQIFESNLQGQLLHNHLEFIDKQAMAASLENRVPYLDDRLVALVNQLPMSFKVNRQLNIQKHILKRIAVEVDSHHLLDAALRQKIGLPSASIPYQVKFQRLCNTILPANYLSTHELGRYCLSRDQLLLFELFLEIFQRYRGILPEDFTMLEFLQEKAGVGVQLENW
jgi:asparagine synthase (glutamine-hydrolysing)